MSRTLKIKRIEFELENFELSEIDHLKLEDKLDRLRNPFSIGKSLFVFGSLVVLVTLLYVFGSLLI